MPCRAQIVAPGKLILHELSQQTIKSKIVAGYSSNTHLFAVKDKHLLHLPDIDKHREEISLKHLKLILAALILGIGLATFTHSVLAQKGIKLVADEDNDI